LSDTYGQIVEIRLVRDHEQRSKGFGYVEFSTADDLRGALDISGNV
jgi:RNA recognition motif-containing protein